MLPLAWSRWTHAESFLEPFRLWRRAVDTSRMGSIVRYLVYMDLVSTPRFHYDKPSGGGDEVHWRGRRGTWAVAAYYWYLAVRWSTTGNTTSSSCCYRALLVWRLARTCSLAMFLCDSCKDNAQMTAQHMSETGALPEGSNRSRCPDVGRVLWTRKRLHKPAAKRKVGLARQIDDRRLTRPRTFIRPFTP